MPERDPIDQMKAILDTMRPHAENLALMSGINQALSDIVMLLERKPEPVKPPDVAAIVDAIRSIKFSSGTPAAQPWTALEIDAPIDALGRPTGKMRITRVQ